MLYHHFRSTHHEFFQFYVTSFAADYAYFRFYLTLHELGQYQYREIIFQYIVTDDGAPLFVNAEQAQWHQAKIHQGEF